MDSDLIYQTNTLDVTPTLTPAQMGAYAAGAGVYGVLMLILAVLAIVASWKIFTKAGQAGWKSLIPFYNTYVLLTIVGRPGWWLLLFFIPLVNIIIAIILAIDLAKAFGRSTTFGLVGLFLFSIIGYAILAFGKDTYLGPVASPTYTPIQSA